MATPTLSQHVGGGSLPLIGGTASPGRRFKFSLPNSIGSGNMILLGLSWTSGVGNPTITDSLGNTWPTSPNVSADAGAGNMISTIWVLPNSLAGANIITVKFPAVINEFQYCLSEFYNVATSGSGTWNGTATTGATPVASPAAGSFTPTNNNANGGNLIWAYFSSSNLVANGNPSLWTPTATGGITPTLLDADIGWAGGAAGFGMPHASEFFVQPTAAAINPAASLTGDAVDTFNCVAIAIPAAAAGTAPAAGIRVRRILHFTTHNFPTGVGTYKLQCPCDGNLGYLTSSITNTLTVADTQSNSWTHVTAITDDDHYFTQNMTPSNSLVLTLSVTTGGNNNQSFRFVDISGAATSGQPDATGQAAVSLNGASVWDNAPTISPTSANGGVIFANVGLGQGPGYGFDTGAPSGAVFDLLTYLNCHFTGQFTTATNLSVTAISEGDLAVGDFINDPDNQLFASITVSAGGGTGNYTTTTAATTASEAMWAGESDSDYADNADCMAHVYYGAGGGTFNWNWLISKMTTNSGSGGAVAFAAAAVAAVIETNTFIKARQFPMQWNVSAALLHSTAQDFSSFGVETNPHWQGRTWPVVWTPTAALTRLPALDVLPPQTTIPVYTRPLVWPLQWYPTQSLMRTTAQDFSSLGVETNVHYAPRTWPFQWNVQQSLMRVTPQDFSTTVVVTGFHILSPMGARLITPIGI